MDRFTKNTQNNNRRIDQLTDEVVPWWQKSYRTVGKREIATWKATVVIMFVAGVAATLIWSAKTDFNDSTKASPSTTLFLSPATTTITAGSTFDLVATINTAGGNAINTVALYVNYNNPTKIRLESITPSTTFSNRWPNYGGQASPYPEVIDTTAGTGVINLEAPSPASGNNVAVATLHFTALEAVSGATITFSTVDPRATAGYGTTDGAFEPGDLLSAKTGAAVTVTAPADTTPPTVTLISPTVDQVLPAGTTTTTLSVTTNETAICKYATTDIAYASMPDENVSAPGTSQSFTLTGLVDSTSYDYYVGCQDLTPNTAVTNVHASFSIDAPTGDSASPIITVVDGASASVTKSDTINVTVADASGIASQFYGFSSDAVCNASDTISTAFTGGTNFTIAGDHTDYLCVKATDSSVGANIGYQLVGQLHTDNTAPVGGSFSINGGASEIVSTSATLNVTCPTDTWTTVQMAHGNSANPTNWANCASTASLTLGSGNGTKTAYMRFRDGGQNTSSDVTDTITLNIPAAPVNGTCGTAVKTFASGDTSWGSYTACGTGTGSLPTFPTAGNSATWTCTGLNGGTTSGTCTASRSVEAAVVTPSPTTPPTTSSSNNNKNSSNNKSSSNKKKTTPARTITNSSKTIKRGAILTQRGKKFSKNSFVNLYFAKPGGGFYAPMKIKTSASGSFVTSYRVMKPIGRYGWYAFDVKAGKKSKTIYYTVK